MRTAVKKILLTTALLLVLLGLLSQTHSEGWFSILVAILIILTISFIFSLRDIVQLYFADKKIPIQKHTVFLHICAALMAILAYLVGFSSHDPRIESIKWPLLILMPAAVYLFAALWWLFIDMPISFLTKDRKRSKQNREPPTS